MQLCIFVAIHTDVAHLQLIRRLTKLATPGTTMGNTHILEESAATHHHIQSRLACLPTLLRLWVLTFVHTATAKGPRGQTPIVISGQCLRKRQQGPGGITLKKALQRLRRWPLLDVSIPLSKRERRGKPGQ